MKKIYLILGTIGMVAATFTACKKSYLNEKPYSSYAPVTLTDSLGFEAELIGLYQRQTGILTWADQQGWPSVWQVGTDVANATANQQGVEVPYYNYSQLTSTDPAASFVWSRYYSIINNCNIIIDAAQDQSLTKIGPVGKKQAEAEAKFFRGYAYNTLATLFGKVPIILHTVTGPKFDYTRASLDDVNNQIISDLTFAATNGYDLNAGTRNVNVQGKPVGRANKYMAMQALAEAYLRMGKNDLAEQQAQAVINSGKFSLIKSRYGVRASGAGDYYSDMFVYGNQRRSQGNAEAIWVLEQENPSTVVGGNVDNAQQRRVWGAAYYAIPGMALADSLGGRSIARLRLSNWVIYSLYKNTGSDIRNSQYSLKRRFYYNDPAYPNLLGKQVPYTGADTLFRICPMITKWGAFDPNDTFGYAMIKDFIMMRLGETYLLLAEAQMKQGKTGDAANTINVLRARANATPVTAADINLDFILDERARELIGEENRRMTLMRTGTLVDRALRLNSNDAQKPITGLTAKNLLLPIPLTEIQLNKDAVLQQNPGY
ncbi:RagB/SusD family nutrient uptake outer membrane protein [Mucilaginibacter sp. KACC 22063]|uniref:RagB/SusD family nutrient uptake outer membrane protein n=1 Tax=Mucilaginibacter sp. KACC 22063 TaxID=3025666 RepID=UPI0023672988|nr:RagB/SusD family nutrient uptake outer membrane protein [Mucilaginibacter sp. KACC 22063]WDF57420.1 RagB/SusD family nutrient uptake outer membrane protein [Mucilaginibacter sp. KACC 22063]